MAAFSEQEMAWIWETCQQRLVGVVGGDKREAIKRVVCEEAYERFRTPLLAGFSGATLEEAFDNWSREHGKPA